MIKTEILKSEIFWFLEVLMSDYSFMSCANKSNLFAVMFEDSQIAQSFSLGSTKLSYNITFGTASYVKNIFLENVDEVKYYSLYSHESCNRIMKKGQMDLLTRFWDSAKDSIQTRYLDSSFLGKHQQVIYVKNLLQLLKYLIQQGFYKCHLKDPILI